MTYEIVSRNLLINPAFNISNENYDSSVAVGLLSIASYVDSLGQPIRIIDGVREKDYLDKIRDEAKDCACAGISVMTTQIPDALKISKIIRDLNPECIIIWGGPHPTLFKEQTIRSPLIDVICVGEGEEAYQEIISKQKLSKIAGIIYKENNEIKASGPRPLHDPSKMPLFNWNLIDHDVRNDLKSVPSLTSRGCPHVCAFCINAILNLAWRPRTVEQVLADLEVIKSKDYFKGKNLRFWDENFFVDIKRAKAIIAGILERDLVIPWETTVRANYLRPGMIDDEFMAKLKASGCFTLSFGAESGCPRILKKIKKFISPDEILNSAKMCLKHGIAPQYSFMIGLPGETRSDMMETLKLIEQLINLGEGVQILGPQAFRPYPGSELYDECLRSGWREPQSPEEWAAMVSNEVNYLTVRNFPWVKDKDFVESMEAYVRFGAHTIKSAMGSSVKAPRPIKFIFILICKLRWKLRFFTWPIEYKLAKKFVSN